MLAEALRIIEERLREREKRRRSEADGELGVRIGERNREFFIIHFLQPGQLFDATAGVFDVVKPFNI